MLFIRRKYPSEFFDREDHQIYIHLPKEYDLDTLRNIVGHGLKNNNLHSGYTVKYLYLMLETYKVTLEEDWKAFNKILIKGGTEISPVSFFVKIEDDKSDSNYEISDVYSAEYDDVFVFELLCNYGLGRMKNDRERSIFLKKINNFLPTLKPGYTRLCSSDFWVFWSDEDYCKLVAAVDLFFYRYKNHAKAYLRMGTNLSRFRDCTMFNMLSMIEDLTGITVDELPEWIMEILDIAVCFRQVTKQGEEFDIPHSISPYFMDLGLSNASPYTASRNAPLHFFAHTVGVLMGNFGSRHVKIKNYCASYAHISLLALIMAYARRKSSGHATHQDDDLPPNSTAEVTMMWWYAKKKQPTEKMLQFAKEVCQNMTGLRVDTIGWKAYVTWVGCVPPSSTQASLRR